MKTNRLQNTNKFGIWNLRFGNCLDTWCLEIWSLEIRIYELGKSFATITN
jgi:hypothetical protein